jgi:hypothetical protein
MNDEPMEGGLIRSTLNRFAFVISNQTSALDFQPLTFLSSAPTHVNTNFFEP